MSSGTHPSRVTSGVQHDTRTVGHDGGVELHQVIAVSDDVPASDHPIVRDVGRVFSVEGFAEPRTPLVVADGLELDVASGTRISSVPVKFPGTGYRIPGELSGVMMAVLHAAAVEGAINAAVDDYYAYVTVQRTDVAVGDTQRGSAVHSDGIQGPRIQPKAPVERGYLLVDRFPPMFFCHGFDVTGVDCDVHLMDPVFERQADRSQMRAFPAGSLVLFDSFCVHQAAPATAPGPRTFLRVAFSTRQYDRQGNTVNAMFAGEYRQHGWEFQPRPIPSTLTDPPARAGT